MNNLTGKITKKDLTFLEFTIKYGRTAYKPYQEWWRERPDETRQPVNSRCQIRRQTKDEDSIYVHIGSTVCAFLFASGLGKVLYVVVLCEIERKVTMEK